MRTVHLKRGKSGPIKAGHPWVFSGSIHRVDGEHDGDVVQVVGDRGDRLGLGLYSENSSIRVRMLGDISDFNDTILNARLAAALRRRETLGVSALSDVYRVVNSEGDDLPGLSVDRFGENLITFLPSTLPMFRRREQIARALADLFVGAAVLERPAPPAIANLEGFTPVETWHGQPPSAPVICSEDGVRYVIDTSEPGAMQKTGHYADMREHRVWIGELAAGRRVLDAYSYTGGFALHSAVMGATRVVAVDSSPSAIAGVQANASENAVTIETHVSDTGDYLRSAFDRGERFDIVVLDPPKLAPRRKHVGKAMKVYEAIAVQAARLVDAHGVLAIGSCSEAIGPDELGRVFASVTQRLGRATHVVKTGGPPADHPYPAAMPEGRYLTFVAAALD